jgi:hypothetical protein
MKESDIRYQLKTAHAHCALLCLLSSTPAQSNSFRLDSTPTQVNSVYRAGIRIFHCLIMSQFSPQTKRTDNYIRLVVLTAVVVKSSIFWDITPYSPSNVNRHFGGTCCLHLQGRGRGLPSTSFMLVSCFAYSCALKMEVICSSETSVEFQCNARRYIPEDRTLQQRVKLHNV